MAKSREHEDSYESGLPSSRAPYDANNSFSSSVKKVATKVTELPQKLFSKWFTAAAEGDEKLENTQIDDETDEAAAVPAPPPNKRPRIRMDRMHPPGTFKIHPPNDSSYSLPSQKFEYNYSTKNLKSFTSKPMMDDSLAAAAGPSSSSGTRGLVTSTPAVSNPRSQLNLGQNNGAATNGIDDNSESSESTSGCSSLIPQTSRQDEPSANNYDSTFSAKRKWADELLEYNDLVGNHSTTSRRTLFLNNTARESMSSRQPSFNASVMNSSVDKNASLASPFYSGNTTYGGASAANLFKRARNTFNTNSELQLKVPKRVTVQVQPCNTNEVAPMSQTTKRILETLENFTSMVTDAKKMPVKRRSEIYSPARRKPSDIDNSTPARVGLRHMMRELVVPTAPDMLRLRRQKLQQTTIGARKIISAISTPTTTATKEYQIRNVKDAEPEFQGKLKSNRRGKGNNLEEEETVEAVNLPSIALPISTLPKFDIALPPSHQKSPVKSVDSTASLDSFKFASPIRVSNVPQRSQSINSFTFSKPLILTEPTESDYSIESSKTMILDKSLTEVPSSTIKPPTKTDSGFDEEIKSEMKLSSGEKKNNVDKKEETGNVWECPECYIRNSGKDGKCAACRTKKPVTVTEQKPEESNKQATMKSNFGAEFKLQTGQWECECCMVRNKQSDANCISCSSPKPQLKAQSKSTIIPPAQVATTSDLMNKFKPAEGSWECPGCLIRNPAVTGVCPCCKTTKPGGETDNKVNTTIVKTCTPSKEPEMWECACCMVRNKSSIMVCPCCEAPKPVIKSSTKKSSSILESSSSGPEKDNEPDEPKTVETSSSKLKFNCEMPASSTTFKFGINNSDKPATTTPAVANFLSTTNKPSETSSFTFGLPIAATQTETPSKVTTSFSFGAPINSNADKLTETKKLLSGEKKNDDLNEKPKTETIKDEQEKKTFSFGGTLTTTAPAATPLQEKPEKKPTESNFVFGNPVSKQSNPLSGFSFGSSKPSFGATADNSKPTTEVKPLFGALSSDTTSNTNATTVASTTTTSITFKNPSEEKVAQPVAPTLNFGVPASTPSSNALSSIAAATTASPVSQPAVPLQEPAKALPNFDSSSKVAQTGFCFGTNSSDTLANSQATNKGLFFGSIAKPATPTVQTTASSSPFGNLSNKNSTAEPAKAFGSFFDNAKPATNTFVFGSSVENKAPVFGAASANLVANNNSSTTTATGAFGSANKSSATTGFANTFGSSNATAAATPNFFSNSTEANSGANNTSRQFAFGATSSQATSATGFSLSTPSPAAATQKPLFSFGASNVNTTSTATATSTATPQQASSAFSGFAAQPAATPAFSFGATPKPETNTASIFGQAAPTTAPIFNASQPANQNNTAAFSAPSNNAFNFGASNPTAQPTPAFQFIPTRMGQPAATAAPPASGGFNFSAPPSSVSFDPNTRPTFNFTGGNAPATFNATPVASQSGVRKIKKAVRRVTQR